MGHTSHASATKQNMSAAARYQVSSLPPLRLADSLRDLYSKTSPAEHCWCLKRAASPQHTRWTMAFTLATSSTRVSATCAPDMPLIENSLQHTHTASCNEEKWGKESEKERKETQKSCSRHRVWKHVDIALLGNLREGSTSKLYEPAEPRVTIVVRVRK